jgi:hypothetical protein
MILTLCHACLQPFLDDRNYRIKPIKKPPDEPIEPHEGECDICTRNGRAYDVDKISNKIKR